MARTRTGRLLDAARRTLTGAVLLAALVWLLWWAQFALMRVEDPLAEAWYTGYLDWGRGTIAVVAVIAALAALHLWLHGRDDVRPRDRADAVLWWRLGERLVHWCFVLSFAVLLATGVELYRAGLGLPDAYTRTMRRWHFGEAFMLFGAALFLLWHRDAIPRRYDGRWLAHLGGNLSHAEPLPAGRFNAGQKLWFWIEALAGVTMALTGWQMRYHFSRLDDGYLTLLGLHLAAAMLFLAVLAVHFYLAVVGVRGALGGMLHGRIGRKAAERLHSEAEALRQPVAG